MQLALTLKGFVGAVLKTSLDELHSSIFAYNLSVSRFNHLFAIFVEQLRQ